MTSANEAATPDEPQFSAALLRQRKVRVYTILLLAAVALLTLLTTTQTWWTLHLDRSTIVVAGSVAAPAISALGLCGLALAAALAISGPVFRLILGVIQLVIGFTIVLTSILSLHDPEQPSASLITAATGVTGDSPLHDLIQSVSVTAWGPIAIAVGVLAFIAGLWLLATFRLWPPPSRKYQSVQFAPAEGPRDAVVDWDALSSGEDPTEPL